MKRLFALVPAVPGGKIVVLGMLGVLTLLLNPGAEACGPYLPKLHCPVVGLGKEVQPSCCPKTPFTYWSKIHCSYQAQAFLNFDYKGGTIYFCCEQCVPIFMKSPEKFAANANHQLFASRQAKQVHCPLCGGSLQTAAQVRIGGVNVAVCSAACKKQIEEAKPLEQLQMLFGEEAFARGFVMKVKTAAPAQQPVAPASSATTAGASGGCCCQQSAVTQKNK